MHDLPPILSGPAAWYGPAMAARPDWREALDAADLGEIEAAATAVLERGLDIAQIRLGDFALPKLAPRLQRLRQELLEGRGFVLLRGLPVRAWGTALSAAAFFGIGTHLGQAVAQNAQGHVLGHVKDLGLASQDPRVRIYQTAERQTFHTDSCDIVGLLCLQQGLSGGDSALVSSNTVWNEMRRRAPALAARLLDALATDRRGEWHEGEKPYFEIPVFNWFAGHLSCIYQRQYIDSAQRFADAPRLSEAHVQALDLFDSLCEDPALHFLMRLEPGDLQFVQNHDLLHDRTAFVDGQAPEQRRHLLRLWLAPEQARPLPPVFAQRYGNVTPGLRGGVQVPRERWCAPLAMDHG